jgi:hypothetical protein
VIVRMGVILSKTKRAPSLTLIEPEMDLKTNSNIDSKIDSKMTVKTKPKIKAEIKAKAKQKQGKQETSNPKINMTILKVPGGFIYEPSCDDNQLQG